MSENLREAISVDEAADQLFAQSQKVEEPEEATLEADDEAEEADTEELDAEEAETDEGKTDDEAESDEEADEVEEEGNGEDETDHLFEIETVNGKQEVTLSELTQGYMRTADYTKKTMELAEQRKAFEGENQQISQIKQQLSAALEYWAVPVEQEPNWAELAQQHTPQEVFALQQQWKERTARKEQATQHHQALRAQEIERVRAEETEKLLGVFPEWRDPATFQAAAQKVVETGGHYGFTTEEMVGIVDHRMFKVLEDARKYRELQTAKPKVAKKVSKAPKKLKPGSKPNKSEAKKAARQKQMDRLKQSGSVHDAVALLLGE